MNAPDFSVKDPLSDFEGKMDSIAEHSCFLHYVKNNPNLIYSLF